MTPRNPDREKIVNQFVSNKVTELQKIPGFIFRRTLSMEWKEYSPNPFFNNPGLHLFDKIISQFRDNTGTDPIIANSSIGPVLINPTIPSSREAAKIFLSQKSNHKL